MSMALKDRFRQLCGPIGAKQISMEAILPMILLPAMLCIAAINVYWTIIVCVAIPLLLGYAQYVRRHYLPRTKFFFMWAFWSIVYLWILFEMTVPLTELLPEENFIFIATMFGSVFCFYKTKTRASMNYVAWNIEDDGPTLPAADQTRVLMNEADIENNENGVEEIDDIESDESDYRMSSRTNTCPKCHKYIPPRAYHCTICQQCICKRDHHSIWLDCCIGESNHRLFLLSCGLGTFSLLFGANLSLTSICHPFFVLRLFSINILMPDDCSEVYDQYDIALCFVGSIYATVMAICGIIILIQQCFLMGKGVTASEWSSGASNRNGSLGNLKTFICCSR